MMNSQCLFIDEFEQALKNKYGRLQESSLSYNVRLLQDYLKAQICSFSPWWLVNLIAIKRK